MLRLSAASKRFHDDGPWVLKDIELTIPESSFFCLLGPSGCGKSTILNMIAGFEAANSGTIVHRNRPIVAPGPDRFVIFQEAGTALFSWLNVRENIEFGMRVQGRRRAERHPVVDRYLSMVGLSDHGSKFPDELSGGMKQRLQLARALALEPEILLMDEPFGALDAITRRRLQHAVRSIWRETGSTVIFVTHDIEEAIFLGTHIAVMTAGPEATIKCQMPCEVSEPRDPSNPEFGGFYKSIEELIREEIGDE